MYILTIFWTISIICSKLQAQKITAYNDSVPNTYNFWLYTPDRTIDDEIEPKPVIIFLHGASLCGRNLEMVKRYGTIDAIEKGRNIDAYVIAPQNPGGSWNPNKLMQILDWVSDNHNIDYDRVYAIGMSLGGYGTIDLAAAYPDRIAAAIAMCGGSTVSDLSSLNDVPLWIIHGTADRAVSVQQSDKVVAEMRQADTETPRLIYNRVQGMNHSRPARMFYLTESYEWLFRHTLKDENREVAPSFELTDEVLQSAYNGLKNIKRSGKTTKRRATRRKRK
ncbi:MAG: dienelactone hydrolase family protein [Paramuribaculum sp.]|nr:dienelactone hydrolase family protein [Paramuribaculum sp.]